MHNSTPPHYHHRRRVSTRLPPRHAGEPPAHLPSGGVSGRRGLAGPFTPVSLLIPHWRRNWREIGVILLMFGVGLHFSLKDLLAVKSSPYTRRRMNSRRYPCWAWGCPAARLGSDLRAGVRPRLPPPAPWCAARWRNGSDRQPARANRHRLADRRRFGDGADAGVTAGSATCWATTTPAAANC